MATLLTDSQYENSFLAYLERIKPYLDSFDPFHQHILLISAFHKEYPLIFQELDNYLQERLDYMFSILASVQKKNETIKKVKEYLIYEWTSEFIASEFCDDLLDDYTENDFHFVIRIRSKIDLLLCSRLKIVKAILILFYIEPGQIKNELKHLGLPEAVKKKGRPGKWDKYFLQIFLEQKNLEKLVGRWFRGKSDYVVATKSVIRRNGHRYRRSIYTSFYNWLKKNRSKL